MRKRFFLFLVLLLILLSGFSNVVFGQVTGDYRSRITGNWGTAGSWERYNGSTWVIATVIPAAANNVTVQSAHTITMNSNPGACTNLTINGILTWTRANTLNVGGNLTISEGTLSGTRTGILNVAGTFTVPASVSASIERVQLTISGSSSISGTINFTNLNGTKSFYGLVTVNTGGSWNSSVAQAFVFRGGITNNGTFIAGTGTSTFNTNSQSISGSSPITFGGIVAIVGNITLTNNTTVSITGNLTGSVAGSTWLNAANSTLNAGNVVLQTGTLNAAATGNTVNYNRAANQTIKAATYYHLTLSGTGTKTQPNTLTTVNGDFTTTTTGTLVTTTAANLTIGGNLSIGAGTTFTAAGFNLAVNGTTSISGIHAHSNATGTKTHTGDVTINSGGSWTNGSNEGFTFGGNLQNNGTLTSGTGIYLFTGASKTLSGTNGITIANTTINGSYTNQTTFTSTTTLSGTGLLTQADNVTLNIGAASAIATLNASATGNTVNYTGAAQTVKANNYFHLNLSGSGIKTMPASPITIGGNFSTAGTVSATAGAAIAFLGNVTLGAGTTVNASTFSHTIGGNWLHNGATFNASTGTITFNGSSVQSIGGTIATTFNNLVINNSSGLVLNRPVNTSTLNLNSGIVTTTSTNLLSVTGTAAGSIIGNYSSSYVNGPLARTLPANLSNGNYIFPIGKSGYNALELLSANTNAGGTVIILAEVFDSNSGGTPGIGLSSLNTNRYWSANITSGNANFTNANIRLTEPGLGPEDAIGQSATQSGAYDRISNDPPSGNTLTSGPDPITSLGFFAIGEKPTITIVATSDGTEGGSNGLFTLSTSKNFTVSRTINITITGTAINGTDYTTITSPITFPAGQSTVTIPVTVINDFLVEPTETVIITVISGTGYAIGTPSSATVNIFDNDIAGITVSPVSGLQTTEAGGTAAFTMVLTSQPTANVTIGLSSNNLLEGTVSPSSVTFTSVNWSVAQTATITGVNDFVQDGNILYSIITAPATSADANYAGRNAADVSVTNIDNDLAGITVSPTSGLVTTEAGGTATFTIVLNSQPTASVTIGLSSDDTTEGTVSPASIVFSTLNWNVAQTVTITGVNDFMVDGPVLYNIITAQATSTDPLYSAINPADVSVTNIDDDFAGIVVNPTSGLYTSESGGQATFTIVLTSQPTHDVTIALYSDDVSEGTISTSSMVFNSGNWNVPQTVTITGVDDLVEDGDIPYKIITSPTVSDDLNYNGIDPNDVEVVNQDNDVAGITVNPTSGLTTTEAGGTASFSIVLNTQPTDDVTIGLSSSNTNEGTLAVSSATFTDLNWNIPQIVLITGVDDFIDDGNIAYTIITDAAVSADAKYQGINPPNVSVTNIDDDVAGITVSPTAGLTTTEAGGTATFTMKLNSQPLADVTVGLSSNNTAEGTVSPASVTFTPVNWNTEQTITITGVNDDVDDGDKAYTIITAQVNSTDPLYSVINPSDVSVTNIDDDTAGITVNPTNGLTTTEAGGTATFTIVLNSQPTADVVIDLSSDNPDEGTVSPAIISFTSATWSSAQTITITGVDDFVMDGDILYTILLSVEPGADTKYNAIDPDDVSVTNADDDVAGFTFSATTGLSTTEAGGQATFTLRLNSEPTANVVIGLTSSDLTEGTVSPASLTFTPVNWSSTQTVTITGVNDFVQDGDIPYSIITAQAVSVDGNYSILNPSDVSVTNIDNDVAGITVSPTSGLVTNEDGLTAQFSVVLTSEPIADVTIGISSSNTNEGIVSTSSLLFTSGNWNTGQPVTITGVDDNSIDGNIAYTIYTAPAVSGDPNYSGRDAENVSVTNYDNDVAGITITPTSGLTTTEDGGTDTFTIELNTIPTSSVTIGLSSSNVLEGTVSPTSVTILPANWNVPVEVTVTGVDDLVDDGDIAYNIITSAASSADGNYNTLNPADVSVTNIDDDDAGITVTAAGTLITSEGGTTATFTIVLDTKPTVNVTINFTLDATEGTLSPTSVTFTPLNWNTAVTVTVTGKDDNDNDGDITYNIVSTANSADLKYHGLQGENVTVTNLDNDTPGITVNPSSGLTTTEAGGTATFTMVLITEPKQNVIIGLTSSNTAEGTVSPSTLTFTKANYNTPQTVTITGVNDALVDGDVIYSILFSLSSTDNDYDGLDVNDVQVTNTDLTPTIALGSNPTVCSGATSANLTYSATTKTPNQYSIVFDAAALSSGFVNVTNTALPASPITITVPLAVAAGTYNATLTVRNSTYGVCISPSYPITISINNVTAGTVGSDQNIGSGGDPALLTSTVNGSGSGTITYRWESGTTDCSTGFNAISGATSSTYDPPSGLMATTYYRRVTISTLNSIPCEAISNCITISVSQITASLILISTDYNCPELDILKGFNANNNGPYSAGATEIIFSVQRNGSFAPTWEFDYVIQDATVRTNLPVSPQPQNITISGIVDNAFELRFFIDNVPGSEIKVKLVILEVRDSYGGSDPTDQSLIATIKSMPVVGLFN